jgi:hypothetical protein
MAGALPNRQPIFTDIPILYANTIDPKIPSSLIPIDNFDIVYANGIAEGILIDRITVTSTPTLGGSVESKIIWIGVIDNNTGIATVYKAGLMAQLGSLTPTDTIPSVEFVFNGGLILKQGDQIIISASTNQANTGQPGDQIAIVLEGGSYNIP